VSFIQETIMSINLITGLTDKKAYQLAIQLVSKDSTIDPLICDAITRPERNIAKYHYWRDRLLILQQEFNESEPTSLKQWWIDRRKKVQWYTFWIASLVLIMTFVFGMIASVASVIQVYAALHPKLK
jgi:hypothetical protein